MRVYMDGYDLSGYASKIGPLAWRYALAKYFAFSDPITSYLPSTPEVSPGEFSGIFDNTATSGLHALLAAPGAKHILTVAIGIRAAPALGDPVFSDQFYQSDYLVRPEGEAVLASINFSDNANDGSTLAYSHPWGVLLNANVARTAVNSSAGVDNDALVASTTKGGMFVYHVTAGNGTATIKAQDAATNSDGSFADLSGATSGSINCATPQSGIVALANTATVRQFLRWQIVLGSATSVTFVAAFNRAYGI
jgi:hypothetical protein